MAAEQRVYTIPEINSLVQLALKNQFGEELSRICVKGEINDFSVSKGMKGSLVFFTLTDGKESLTCLSYGICLERLLRSQHKSMDNAHQALQEIFAKKGKVECTGILQTYNQRGRSVYQLLVYSLCEFGIGEKLRRLKELEEKLRKHGYFDADKKKPLPRNPSRVAIITARRGAVIHDFLRTARSLGLGARCTIFSVRVQGEGAGAEIAAAVRRASLGNFEVIVLIRGGGSEDDLACFNDEELANAIFTCPIPVLAGIGHEVNTTFAELVADKRAPTPTAAAQLLWTPRIDLAREVESMAERLRTVFGYKLDSLEREVQQLDSLLQARDPIASYTDKCVRVEKLSQSLNELFRRFLSEKSQLLEALAARLPQGLRSKISLTEQDLDFLTSALKQNMKGGVAQREHMVQALDLQLAALDPKALLQRGYALVSDDQGAIRTIDDVCPDSLVTVHVYGGQFTAKVRKITR